QAELHQVVRLDLLDHLVDLVVLLALHLGAEANTLLADTVADDLLDAIERAAADKEDVGGVDLDKVLMRVLASALRRNVCRRTFEHFVQCLLYALARYVSGDGRVFRLTCDFINLIDVNDAALGLFYVEVSRLDQSEQDILNVLTDVTRFGQRGCVC